MARPLPAKCMPTSPRLTLDLPGSLSGSGSDDLVVRRGPEVIAG